MTTTSSSSTMASGSRATRVRRAVLYRSRLFFDKSFHLLAFIVGGLILTNVIFNVAASLATTGTTGMQDPQGWVAMRVVSAHPTQSVVGGAIFLVFAGLALLGHLASHKPIADSLVPELVSMYNLGQVQAISPTPRYIPQYRPYYVPRRIRDTSADADQDARLTLRVIANAGEPLLETTKYGICVTGRRMLGSTRLAWEAMKAERELSSWTFVDWPIDAQRYGTVLDYLKQQRTKAVLWLDNLAKYLNSPNQNLLNYLPYALSERGLRFVIVATCDDDEYPAVQTAFRDLLSRLQPIPLADITAQEARDLESELAKSGPSPYGMSQYDGTPGSVILGVTYMRDKYEKLPAASKQVLRAIKLLRSAGILDLPTVRVVRIAKDLVHSHTDDWTDALAALAASGFIGQRTTVSGEVITLTALQEVYLGVAVPDYTGPSVAAQSDWPALEQSLLHARDARALLQLGDAYRSKRDDMQALACYRGALQDITRESASDDWARARLGVAIVLSHQVDNDLDKAKLDALLEEAQEAFRDALSIITVETLPNVWAEAQAGLAAVVRHGARTTKGRKRRIQMLDGAAANCRAALRILKKESTPEKWADTQLNLALILQTHAPLAQDPRTRRDLLDAAIAAHRKALEVYTEDDYALPHARIQRHLGDTLKARAPSSARKAELYQDAVSAYSTALAVWGRRLPPQASADVQSSLGSALMSLADTKGTTDEVLALRSQAAEVFGDSARGYQAKQEPVSAAFAYSDRGVALRQVATPSPSEARNTLIAEAIEAQKVALKVLGQKGSYEIHARVHLELATLYWLRASDTPSSPGTADPNVVGSEICGMLTEARLQGNKTLQYCRGATSDNEEHEKLLSLRQQAQRLQRDIGRTARAVGCSLPAIFVAAAPSASDTTAEVTVID